MKIALIALAASLAAATAASAAAPKVTDVDFMRAARCKGLATSISGVIDPAPLDAFLKTERVSRAPYVLDRADEEFERAKREARSADRKDRLTAELTGSCQAYLGAGASLAKQ